MPKWAELVLIKARKKSFVFCFGAVVRIKSTTALNTLVADVGTRVGMFVMMFSL